MAARTPDPLDILATDRVYRDLRSASASLASTTGSLYERNAPARAALDKLATERAFAIGYDGQPWCLKHTGPNGAVRFDLHSRYETRAEADAAAAGSNARGWIVGLLSAAHVSEVHAVRIEVIAPVALEMAVAA